jgi:hypothetical protein
MDGRFEAVVAGVSGLGASLAVAVPDNETVEALGRWPLTVVLGAVCCFCVWIIYKQGCKFGERLDKLSDAIKDLAKCLSERPCIRHKEND